MSQDHPALEETYEHHAITADPGQKPYRIDKFLVNFLQNRSRHKIQLAIKAGNVEVNGQVVKANHKIKAGDEIKIVMSYPPQITELIPQDIPVNIVYEDDYLAVINKAAGMVVHPGFGNMEGTLVNALAYKWQDLPQFQKKDEFRPGLVHRIDKDTSGLLVVAKEELALNKLSAQFFHKTTERRYIALVWGKLQEEHFAVEGYIGRANKDRKIMQIFDEEDKGKWSKTHIRVLKTYRFFTLIECQLETGRTHQIRAHLKHIGHPLFADEAYGGDKVLYGENTTKYKQFINNCFKIMNRQALHASTLGFVHPHTEEQMHFESELPADLNELLAKISIFQT